MKISHLFSSFGQLFKEKRLAYEVIPGLSGLLDGARKAMAPAGAPTQSQAPAAAPGATPATAPETPATMKNRIGETVKRLKEKMKIVTDNPDKYTQGLVDVTKEIEAKITDIETKLNSQEVATVIATLSEEEAKEALKKFDEELTKIETEGEESVKQAFGGKDFPEALAENEEAKKLITEKRAELETRRTELKSEEIIDEIIEGMNIQDEAIKTALKEKVNKDGLAQKEMDDFLEEIGVILDDADKASLTKQEAEEKIKEATTRLKDSAFTKDGFKGQFEKSLFEPYKPTLEAYERLIAFGSKLGGGENCKLAMAGFGVAVGELIKADTPPSEETIKKLEEEHTQIILIGHIADVIQESPEKIKSALLFYELGKYESADSPENAGAKAIIDKIMAQKGALSSAGVAIDFLGGTDGTAHGIHTEPEWHEAKVKAFQKLLDLTTAGKITPPLDAAQIYSITAYMAAVEAGTGVDFVKENKDDFLAGGKLFDMALALQRAEDMKKRISGDSSAELSTTDDFVSLDLGTTQNTKTERKSGIKFRAVPVEATDPNAVPAPDPNAAPAADPNAPVPVAPNAAPVAPAAPDNQQPATPDTPAEPEEKTLSDGSTGRGLFDEKDPSKLIAGERTYLDGTVEEGVFDKETGNLIQGTRKFPNGTVLEGEFDRETGIYIVETQDYTVNEGKITLETTRSDGTTEKEEYTTEAPAGTEFFPADIGDDGQSILVSLDNKDAEFRISTDGNLEILSSGDLLNDYDITLDTSTNPQTIKILKKSASAAAPAADPNAVPAPDPNAAPAPDPAAAPAPAPAPDAAPTTPPPTPALSFDPATSKITREITLANGTKETKTYTISAPPGARLTEQVINGINGINEPKRYIQVTLDDKTVSFTIDNEGVLEINQAELLYDYGISLNGNTVAIEKLIDPEYHYRLDGNTLTLNRTKDGDPEVLTYTIENPDNLKLDAQYSGGDADVTVSTSDDSKVGWFEIRPTGEFSTGPTDTTDPSNLANDYDVTLDESTDPKTIRITKRPAALTEKILHDSSLAIGTFDPDTGNLTEGKVTRPDGMVLEGKFDKDTGNLTQGKLTYPDGTVDEGKFDGDTVNLTGGTRTYPDGEVDEGKFDKDNGKPLPGNKRTSPDGRVFILNENRDWILQ